MSARLQYTAENLKRALVSKGYSQTRLAEVTGLNRATVNNYFTGKQEPFQESFIKLAETLGHEPEFLVVKQEEHPADPNAFLTPLELRVLESVNEALDRLAPTPAPAPEPILQAAEVGNFEEIALRAEAVKLMSKLPAEFLQMCLAAVTVISEEYEKEAAQAAKKAPRGGTGA